MNALGRDAPVELDHNRDARYSLAIDRWTPDGHRSQACDGTAAAMLIINHSLLELNRNRRPSPARSEELWLIDSESLHRGCRLRGRVGSRRRTGGSTCA